MVNQQVLDSLRGILEQVERAQLEDFALGMTVAINELKGRGGPVVIKGKGLNRDEMSRLQEATRDIFSQLERSKRERN